MDFAVFQATHQPTDYADYQASGDAHQRYGQWLMNELGGVPTEIKQWTLTEIVKQPHGGRLDLHFRNGADKEFAYAHHDNCDWFEFKSDARERARELFSSHEKSLNERLESLNKHRNRLLKPITSQVNWVTAG